jgi:hypothetical protein
LVELPPFPVCVLLLVGVVVAVAVVFLLGRLLDDRGFGDEDHPCNEAALSTADRGRQEERRV